MNGHTPGPWVVNRPENISAELYGGDDSYQCIEAGKGFFPEGFALMGVISIDNARLIAAAPALLEALEYCIKSVPEFKDIPGIISALKQVNGAEYVTHRSEWRDCDLWHCIDGDWIAEDDLKKWCANNMTNDRYVDVVRQCHITAYAGRKALLAELLPCPICNGIESCDHTVLERRKGSEQ